MIKFEKTNYACEKTEYKFRGTLTYIKSYDKIKAV